MEAELRGMKSLKWIRPFLYLLGPKGWKAAREMKTVLNQQLPQLEARLERLRDLPDKLNEVFLNLGWIATDDMSVEAMDEAIRIDSENGSEDAEVYLENYYNENLDNYLRRMWFLPQIQQRRPLLELALEDHKAGRYHASVPVLLAQIDGIVFDLTRTSFYIRGTKKKQTMHLRANETTVGDPTGLPALAQLLSESRSETRDLPISLPFRHGILHGRDLGYATHRVSTKAFGVLLALRPWVLAVDRGEQFRAPEEYFDPATATWPEVKEQWTELWASLKDYAQQHKDT